MCLPLQRGAGPLSPSHLPWMPRAPAAGCGGTDARRSSAARRGGPIGGRRAGREESSRSRFRVLVASVHDDVREGARDPGGPLRWSASAPTPPADRGPVRGGERSGCGSLGSPFRRPVGVWTGSRRCRSPVARRSRRRPYLLRGPAVRLPGMSVALGDRRGPRTRLGGDVGDRRGVAADRDSLASRRTTGVETGAAPASPRLLGRCPPPRCDLRRVDNGPPGRRTIGLGVNRRTADRLAGELEWNRGDARAAPPSRPVQRGEHPAKRVTLEGLRSRFEVASEDRSYEARAVPLAAAARRGDALPSSVRLLAGRGSIADPAPTTVTLNLDPRLRYWARGQTRFSGSDMRARRRSGRWGSPSRSSRSRERATRPRSRAAAAPRAAA